MFGDVSAVLIFVQALVGLLAWPGMLLYAPSPTMQIGIVLAPAVVFLYVPLLHRAHEKALDFLGAHLHRLAAMRAEQGREQV